MNTIGFKNFQVYVSNLVVNANEFGKFEDFSYDLDEENTERVLYIWTSNARNNPHNVTRVEYDSAKKQPWFYTILTGWNFDRVSEHGYGLSLKEAVAMANTTRHKEVKDGFYL